MQDQVIALADFSARNDLEIGSADHEYARFFAAHPGACRGDAARLGERVLLAHGHWAFLSLTGKTGPVSFSRLSGWRAASNRCEIVTERLPRLPATMVTDAAPWAYAATSRGVPSRPPPPELRAWIRCRLRVDGGADRRQPVDCRRQRIRPVAGRRLGRVRRVWCCRCPISAARPPGDSHVGARRGRRACRSTSCLWYGEPRMSVARPFAARPGRDVTKDQPLPYRRRPLVL